MKFRTILIVSLCIYFCYAISFAEVLMAEGGRDIKLASEPGSFEMPEVTLAEVGDESSDSLSASAFPWTKIWKVGKLVIRALDVAYTIEKGEENQCWVRGEVQLFEPWPDCKTPLDLRVCDEVHKRAVSCGTDWFHNACGSGNAYQRATDLLPGEQRFMLVPQKVSEAQAYSQARADGGYRAKPATSTPQEDSTEIEVKLQVDSLEMVCFQVGDTGNYSLTCHFEGDTLFWGGAELIGDGSLGTSGTLQNAQFNVEPNPQGGYLATLYDFAVAETLKVAVDLFFNVETHMQANVVGVGAGVTMLCHTFSPTFCRRKNFYFQVTVGNTTPDNITGLLFFGGYSGYYCDPAYTLVTIPRNKTYAPGLTVEHYFFKVPSAAGPGQYSASISGTLSGFDVYCCMNTDIIECGPWRIGDNTEWELVEVERPEVELPMFTSLGQNYPNPFNVSTNISYSLAEAENVSLKVYDIAGRLVQTLVDEVQDAGSYTVTWDASEVSSGVYFYKLTAGDYTLTKKMNLLK